jgi:hypothetical protein
MEYKVKKENIIKLTKYLEKKYEHNRMGKSISEQYIRMGQMQKKQ